MIMIVPKNLYFYIDKKNEKHKVDIMFQKALMFKYIVGTNHDTMLQVVHSEQSRKNFNCCIDISKIAVT